MNYLDYFDRLSDKTVTDSELSALENKIQFTLPEDYKMFLKEQNGITVKKEYMCSFPIKFCSSKRDVLQCLFCIDSVSEKSSIYHWIDFYSDEIRKKETYLMIPIGISAFGSVIFLKRNGKIILADFSLSFKSSLPFKCTYSIAKSFSGFIDSLLFKEKLEEFLLMETNMIVARRLREFVNSPQRPPVGRFWDEPEQKSIDVFKGEDVPQKGVQVCATIGLNNTDIGLVFGGLPLRVELIGACDIRIKTFQNMIATAAFKVMDSHRCFPGYIITDVISKYIHDSDMKHFLLRDPFLWEDAESITANGVHIAWLMTVPISDKEFEYACDNGSDALGTIFVQKDIDVYDIYRRSVI